MFGVLKAFDEQQGYGFIACTQTMLLFKRDVFVHKKEILVCKAVVGSKVQFFIELNEKGQPQARQVELLDGNGLPRGGGTGPPPQNLKQTGWIPAGHSAPPASRPPLPWAAPPTSRPPLQPQPTVSGMQPGAQANPVPLLQTPKAPGVGLVSSGKASALPPMANPGMQMMMPPATFAQQYM